MNNNTNMRLHSFLDLKNMREHFKELLTKCEWLKGCTAFWTIKPGFFDNKLEEVLRREDSFYCTHLGGATNIDALNEFHLSKPNIYIYNFFWKSHLEEGNHPPLLHAKVSIFKMPEDKVVIWVGSHNFTQAALLDLNIEASTVIETTTKSDYYKQTLSFLENVKGMCDKYDPIIARLYLILQGRKLDRLTTTDIALLYGLDVKLIDYFIKTQVIYLVGKNVNNLSGDSLIQIIGLDDQFNKSLSTKQKIIVLYIRESDTTDCYIYLAKILLSADIDEEISDSYGIEFSSRRYAVLKRNVIGAVLNESEVITPTQLEKANYVSSVQIERCIDRVSIYPFPNSAWEEIDYSEVLKSISLEDKEKLLKTDFKLKKEDQGKYQTNIEHRDVKLKRINYDLEELKILDTEGIPQLDEDDFENLVNYYKENLAMLEQTKGHIDVHSRMKSEHIPLPNNLRLKQTTHGKIIVVQKENQK